jgi:hypothetical protein
MPRGQPKLALVERDDEDESSDDEDAEDIDEGVAAADAAGASAGPSSASTSTKQKGISLSLQKNRKDLVCHVGNVSNSDNKFLCLVWIGAYYPTIHHTDCVAQGCHSASLMQYASLLALLLCSSS